MSFESNVRFFGFFRPLGASGSSNLLDRRPGGPRHLHSRLNFLRGRFVKSGSSSRRSICSVLLRLLVVTTRGNRFYIQPQKKKERTAKSQNPQKYLRCHEVKELDTLFENRGFVSRSSLCRGTRRSKLVDTLPLLVYTSVFGKRRRRRCR
jgi:hypothetical protein